MLVLTNSTARSVASPLITPIAIQTSDPSGVTTIEPWEPGVAAGSDTVVTIWLVEVLTTSTHGMSFGGQLSAT